MAEIIIFLSLLATGYVVGTTLERHHYKSILKREYALRKLPLIASKKLPDDFLPCETSLVTGNVVISIDYFKHRITSYNVCYTKLFR